jgi:uncharacterized protein YcgI (DUF1989 family)
MTKVTLTAAQMELVQRVAESLGGERTPADVLRATFAEHARQVVAGGSPYAVAGRTVLEVERPRYGAVRLEETLEPVTGRAVPVLRGEVLRIAQVDGGQCVDFNAYNLHNYKEFLDCGMNRLRGLSTGEGTIVWSGMPYGRPMYGILSMPETCDQYYSGHRCNGLMYEMEYGLPEHPNCQDTFAEAIREYALGPDDVHDSYNLWMTTTVDAEGRRTILSNRGLPGDHCDFVAFFDTLAVPVVCAGDLSAVNNYSPSPIRLTVYEPSPESLELADLIEHRLGSFSRQESPSDFRVAEIRAERRVERDPSYRPRYRPFGAPVTLDVDLSAEEERLCDDLLRRGMYGSTVGTCLVAGFCRWFEANHVSNRHTSLRFS